MQETSIQVPALNEAESEPEPWVPTLTSRVDLTLILTRNSTSDFCSLPGESFIGINTFLQKSSVPTRKRFVQQFPSSSSTVAVVENWDNGLIPTSSLTGLPDTVT